MDKTKAAFTASDLVKNDVIFNFLCKRVGWESFSKVLGLGSWIFLPFFTLSIISLYESRFHYKSVIMHLEGYGDALGMSFLGDTMVWPFCFIVPILFLISKYAVSCSVELMNRIHDKSTIKWKEDNDYYGLEQSTARARAFFDGSRSWAIRCLALSPWVIALLFWGYNTMTCSFHQYLREDAYPYKTNNVQILENEDIIPTMLPEGAVFPMTIEFEKKVHLPKWDTDFENAPFTNIATRIWTVLFYCPLPFLVIRIIMIVCGVTNFLVGVKRWENEHQGLQAIDIEPFGGDGFGGLSFLADTGMSYMYFFIGFIVLLVMSFLKEGVDPSWHNYLLIFMFLPLAFIAFITPAVAVRRPIMNAKERHINDIVGKINSVSETILNNDLKADQKAESSLHFRLSSLKILYDHVNGIPEWPFTPATYIRAFITISVPILLMVADVLVGKFFG